MKFVHRRTLFGRRDAGRSQLRCYRRRYHRLWKMARITWESRVVERKQLMSPLGLKGELASAYRNVRYFSFALCSCLSKVCPFNSYLTLLNVPIFQWDTAAYKLDTKTLRLNEIMGSLYIKTLWLQQVLLTQSISRNLLDLI